MGAHRIYRTVQPYPSTSVATVDFAQSADLMYFAHIGFAPRRLARYGHTDWRWRTVTFGSRLDQPTGTGFSVAATQPNVTGTYPQSYSYYYSDISTDSPPTESKPTLTAAAVTNDLTLNGNYNTLTLPAMPLGVTRRVIYKFQAGAYGYIGNTDLLSFKDNNIIPVLAQGPVEGYNPFTGLGLYPSSVAFHQQRLCWGGTANVINGIYMSRSAEFENMDRARPIRDDDSLAFALVADKVNAVSHIVSLDQLQVFTSDGIWSVGGGADGAGAITASSILPRRQNGRGTRRVKPLVVDTVVFFSPSKGRAFRALGYSFEIQGYKSDNVAIFSPHLFNTPIVRMAYQDEPYACVWAVRADGVLLCFTWEQDQQVWGWSLCDTQGLVLDIAVIAEGGNDRVYLLVQRTINGVVRKFIERMALPHVDDITTACHLDCAITYVGAATGTMSGLWHLEGTPVSVVFKGDDGDLYAVHNLTVVAGKVTLPNGWTTTQMSAGLRYYGAIETLPAALSSAQGSAHVNRQQIRDVVVRTIDSKEIEIGASGTALEMVQELDGTVIPNIAGRKPRDFKITPAGDWKDTSSIIIQQNQPFPAHIVALFPNVDVSVDD